MIQSQLEPLQTITRHQVLRTLFLSVGIPICFGNRSKGYSIVSISRNRLSFELNLDVDLEEALPHHHPIQKDPSIILSDTLSVDLINDEPWVAHLNDCRYEKNFGNESQHYKIIFNQGCLNL